MHGHHKAILWAVLSAAHMIQTWKDTNKNINTRLHHLYTIKVYVNWHVWIKCLLWTHIQYRILVVSVYLCWHVYPLKVTDALMYLNSIMTDDVFIRKWQQLFHSVIDQILSSNKYNGHHSVILTILNKSKTNSVQKFHCKLLEMHISDILISLCIKTWFGC